MVRVLLVFAVLAAGSGLAQAATLASNVGVWTTVYHSEFSYHAIDVSVGAIARAQKFSTGSNAAGYTLSSVEVYVFWVENAATVKMRVCEADSDGDPDTDNCLYTLTNPISYSAAGWNNGTYSDTYLNTFTAPANSTLSASTDYFIVFENDGIQATVVDTYSDYWLAYVFGGSEDSGGASGWSIGDNYYSKYSTATTWSHSTGGAAQPFRIRFNGSAKTNTDTTVPSLDSATVDGTSLELTYNEALDVGSEPATSAYSVSVAEGTGVAPSSVDVTGMKVTLTLGTAVTSGQTVTVSYTVPMSDPVQDTSGNDAAELTNRSVTNNTNAPPVFVNTSTTRSIAETVAATAVQIAANIGAAVTATDSDDDILAYTLEGTDRDKFTIVRASGQIQTKVGESYDYEVKTSYAVTVKASDGTASDTIAVTINVTNETEKPLIPAKPTVTATSGSTTSLDVTWTAPSNTGRPAITGYDLQYRKGLSGAWSDGPQDQTGTSASISGLDGNSAYQVQMRATNDDGDSGWSVPGSGRTANSPPVFADNSTTRSIAETVGDATVSTAANIGAAVTATDAEDATLTYTLDGTDKNKFEIGSNSGQIMTKVGESYDYEAKTSYAVTVKASDGTASDTIAVTINVTNETEKPLTPVAPAVTTTAGSTTSLDVTWTAPSNTGRPAITGYDLQYRKGTGGNFTDGPQNQTGTSTSIPNLDANSAYQVEVQATNVDGDSNWSPAGSGNTANSPPTFTSTSTTRSIDETVGDAIVSTAANIGAAVTATDAEDATLTYTLEGTDKDKFTIVRASGQIQTKVGEAYDYETKTSYLVDGQGRGHREWLRRDYGDHQRHQQHNRDTAGACCADSDGDLGGAQDEPRRDLDGAVEHGPPGDYGLRPAIPQRHGRQLHRRPTEPDWYEREHPESRCELGVPSRGAGDECGRRQQLVIPRERTDGPQSAGVCR